MLRTLSIRGLGNTVVSLLVALSIGAVAAATTTSTPTTTTTLPPTPPSALCTCQDGVCDVVAGSYAVNPGSDLNFGTCALVLDSGATVALTSGAGPGLTIEAASLTMSGNAVIRGAPTPQAPNDGGKIAVNISGNIVLAAGATISVDARDAAASEIDVTAEGTLTLEGGGGAPALSANAVADSGNGGTINLTASGTVSLGAALSAAGGQQGGGGNIFITTIDAPVTVNAPLDGSGGAGDGGTIDIESDLDLVTTSAATLAVDGGSVSGNGGQITLDSNMQGSVTIGGPISGTAGGTDQGGELDSFTTAGAITVNAAVDLSGAAGGGDGGTVDLEPVGDLVVNAALNLAGNSTGGCGGSATLGAVGTGKVTLSASPIDVSSGSCGLGQVVVTAHDTATAPGEINADTRGTTGGGFIQLMAATVTVGGTLHANGGGGEVNLQACTLTLSATGQAVATGPNGFTLLQASGPMEIDGALTATSTNTLDYLDPAQPPVVRSSNIVPPAVIVLNNPPVSSLCVSQATTTTSPSTSTIGVTTTTMAPTGVCSPPSCDDRGVCMHGSCVNGQCAYIAVTGVDCAQAALSAMQSLVEASPTAFKNKAIRRKLVGRLAHLGHLVGKASGQGARATRAKRKAAHAFASFGTFVDGAASHHKVDSALAENLKTLARDAQSALET